jgi:transcriptional regulator with XRE-family HTH domain
MLSGLYERVARQPDGLRLLAGSRLRRRVLAVLHQALDLSRLSQAELAKKLGIRRSAVNQVFRGDGNVRIETLAEYLHEMGFELDVQLVEAGEPRRAALEGRAVRHLSSNLTTATSAAPASITFEVTSSHPVITGPAHSSWPQGSASRLLTPTVSGYWAQSSESGSTTPALMFAGDPE